MEGLDKITAGRVRLLFKAIFYGQIITHQKIVETDQVPTMGVDGTHLFFNPKFTNTLSKAEIEGLLVHEVLHLVLLTHLRQGNKDPEVWNMATDYAINLLVKDEGYTLPQGGLYDEKYRDWAAEKIYRHLIDNPDQQPKGDGWNVGAVSPAGSLGKDGKKGNNPPMTQGEIEAEVSKMKSQIQAAAMAGRKAGQSSANIDRLIEEICAPKADWKEILQRFISEQAFTDWDFAQCHTRILHQTGIISPVLGGMKVGNLAVIVDTSGSVDEKQLAQFAGEISDILENYECKINIVYCDTAVNRTDEYDQDDLPLRLHAVGGGGTKGRPAYEWVAEQLDTEPAAIIHYTDSFLFDWNEIAQPECPALMACTYARPDEQTPEWMEVIDISD